MTTSISSVFHYHQHQSTSHFLSVASRYGISSRSVPLHHQRRPNLTYHSMNNCNLVAYSPTSYITFCYPSLPHTSTPQNLAWGYQWRGHWRSHLLGRQGYWNISYRPRSLPLWTSYNHLLSYGQQTLFLTHAQISSQWIITFLYWCFRSPCLRLSCYRCIGT